MAVSLSAISVSPFLLHPIKTSKYALCLRYYVRINKNGRATGLESVCSLIPFTGAEGTCCSGARCASHTHFYFLMRTVLFAEIPQRRGDL